VRKIKKRNKSVGKIKRKIVRRNRPKKFRKKKLRQMTK
jgi:hypothetical protein